jgi:hypothetical protein
MVAFYGLLGMSIAAQITGSGLFDTKDFYSRNAQEAEVETRSEGMRRAAPNLATDFANPYRKQCIYSVLRSRVDVPLVTVTTVQP